MKKIEYTIFSVLLVVLSIGTLSASVRQTREEYIEKYKKIAVAHMERYGIPASITMAQGLLESDAGNSKLSKSSNNHFGIKCKKDWKGRKVYYDDDAKGECFRAYPSVEASYRDHAEFLDSSPRYDSLFAYSADDYHSWARGLKAAGYATAPDYAQRLVNIIEKYRLYILDREDGAAIYSSAKNAKENAEWFASQSSKNEEEQVNPDDFRVTINAHKGYNIHRVNKVCYVVAKEGDSYASIGSAFYISEKTLRKFNEVSKRHILTKGERVYIERKKSYIRGKDIEHTVSKGETLHSISQRYGIRVKKLAKMNSMSKKSTLRVGSKIYIQNWW